MTVRSEGLGELHEVGIAEGHAVIGQAQFRLLPADHTVAVVAHDEHSEVEAEPHGGLQLLDAHHEAAVARSRRAAHAR